MNTQDQLKERILRMSYDDMEELLLEIVTVCADESLNDASVGAQIYHILVDKFKIVEHTVTLPPSSIQAPSQEFNDLTPILKHDYEYPKKNQ
jgi:hypothetical protein